MSDLDVTRFLVDALDASENPLERMHGQLIATGKNGVQPEVIAALSIAYRAGIERVCELIADWDPILPLRDDENESLAQEAVVDTNLRRIVAAIRKELDNA